MPCVHRRAADERERFIREHRKDVDRFAGVRDPVDVLQVMHARLAYDPLVRDVPYPLPRSEVYASLSAAQCARMIEHAISLLGAGSDASWEIASCLACFTGADLTALHEAMLAVGDPYPGEVFRGASESVVAALVRLADAREQARSIRSHALVALAWSRHPDAVAQLASWRSQPPAWASDLFIPVHQYSESAGWSFDERGQVRQLYRDACRALVLAPEAASRTAVEVVGDSGVECRLCQRPLTVLCSLDLRAPELAPLGLAGTRLSLPVCEGCHAYGLPVFFETATDGTWAWSEKSTTDGGDAAYRDGTLLPRRQLGLGPVRGPMEAASWTTADHRSHVGGLPGWVQDPAYPACPGCNERMLFVAQVGVEDFAAPGEGVYYAFFCERCCVSSATYQQT